jgi:hypothetical protein
MDVKIVLVIILGLIIYFLPGTILSDYKKKLTTLDDVSPVTIETEKINYFLNKHKNENVVIFVVPFYGDITNLTSHKEWIKQINDLQKEYNFTLGLHGYSHKFFGYYCYEFLFPNPFKIKKAREEFKNAFGYYPTFFRAPCFNLDIFDYVYIKCLGMGNLGFYNHGKTYHPTNIEKDWDTLHPSIFNSIFNKN